MIQKLSFIVIRTIAWERVYTRANELFIKDLPVWALQMSLLWSHVWDTVCGQTLNLPVPLSKFSSWGILP